MLLSGSQGNYFALSPQNIFHGFRQSYCEIAGPNSTFLLCLIISRVLSNILCFIFPPTLETKSCQSWRFTNNVCDILLTYISPPPFILLPHFFFYLTLIEPSTFLLYIFILLDFSLLLSLANYSHSLTFSINFLFPPSRQVLGFCRWRGQTSWSILSRTWREWEKNKQTNENSKWEKK